MDYHKIAEFLKRYKEMQKREMIEFIDGYGQYIFFIDLRAVLENDYRNETWGNEYMEISTLYNKAKNFSGDQ